MLHGLMGLRSSYHKSTALTLPFYDRPVQAGWASRPNNDFLPEQNITAGDRASIVDTMTRVATQLQLPSDVLFLGVTCLDRFLAAAPVKHTLLDAAALACLWLAAKFEHRLVPSAAQFLAAAQHHCTATANRSLLVDVEAQVLKVMQATFWRCVLLNHQFESTISPHTYDVNLFKCRLCH